MQFSTNSFVRPLAIGAATIALAVTVGCSAPDESPTSSPVPANTSSAPASAPASPSASSSPDTTGSSTAAESNDAMVAAGRLAAKEINGGTVVSIESERDGWEVYVVTSDGGEQQLRTDPSGTRVVSGPADDRPDADDKAENKSFSSVDIDFVRAVEVTVGEISDAQINELNLDTENRRIVWEADVSTGSQQRTVQIDATSGEVLSNRADD